LALAVRVCGRELLVPPAALRAANPRHLFQKCAAGAASLKSLRPTNAAPAGSDSVAVHISSMTLAAWAAAPGLLGSFGSFPLLILFFVVMYFLLIAPNQRKQKQWNAMLASIKTGDRITTNGGIRGTVLSVKDDVLVVRTQPDGVKLEFLKSAIAAVTTEEPPAAKS
jgi:preprotein translocase subunit YajC